MPPSILTTPLRLLGVIEAGWPSPAEEENPENITVDDWLTDNWEATFMLKTQTTAMKGAGIVPNDMVLLDRSRTARDGDIVLALVDDVEALRYFRKLDNKVWLEAAQPNIPPLVPHGRVTVIGVAFAVIRKYF